MHCSKPLKVLSLIMIVALLGACSEQASDGGSTDRLNSSPRSIAASVEDILSDPTNYYKSPGIVLPAYIVEVVAPNIFTVRGEKDTSQHLLVINTGDHQTLITGTLSNTRITAHGTVRPFTLAALEQEQEIDLPDELFASYDQSPVLFATEIITNEASLVDPPLK